MAQSHTALNTSAAHQGEDICPAPCSGFFPSPLLWGEGEPFSPRRTIQTRRLSTARCAPFPLPEGEVRVRGIGLPFNPATRTLPETSNFVNPLAEPAASPNDYETTHCA